MSAASAAQHPAPELGETLDQAAQSLEALLAQAALRMREKVVVEGASMRRDSKAEQHAAHGLAWLATYVQSVTRTLQLLRAADRRGALRWPWRRCWCASAPANIAPRRFNGIPMSQGEILRLSAFGFDHGEIARFYTPAIAATDR